MLTHTDVNVAPTVLRKVVIAAALGNFVEWFDFAVYGFLATTLANEFFPSASLNLGLLKTFGVFAVAFAMRPLGGLLLGPLGDKLGRKSVLSLTILMMAGATTLIGCLPNYASIGIMAPVLLTLLRCIQGFSAGGEYAGSVSYVMEHAPRDRRGRYGSFISMSTFTSFACAALLVFGLESSLPALSMESWGWRIPFLVAAPLGAVGVYLRLRLEETPAFQAISAFQATKVRSNLGRTLRQQVGAMCCLGMFIALTALSFYTFSTYFATFLQVNGKFSRPEALLISTIALVSAAALCPVCGRFIDKVGRRRSMGLICAWVLLTAVPAFWLAGAGSLFLAVLGVLLLAVGVLASNVVTAPLLSEVFPTHSRYTASALTYNLSYTLFGGTAPLVATWLIGQTGSSLAPAFYLMAISVLAALGGLSLPETSRISLTDADLQPSGQGLAAALGGV